MIPFKNHLAAWPPHGKPFSTQIFCGILVPMKILHTADLHLGKTFHEHPLIEDQQHMLGQLTRLLVDEGDYQALIMAGDIYDRAVPSPEAVELFGSFLSNLRRALPQLQIIIISGNHDSARRLSFAADLLRFQQIHIATTSQDMLNPILIDDAAIYPLAFLHPSFLGDDEIHQNPMVQAAIHQILDYHRSHHPQLAKLLVAHLFTQGGISSDSERSFVGTAELVDGALLQQFDYVALGHLHRCQNPGGTNIWYSGSPLAYSFSEADNQQCFLKVELEPSPNASPQQEGAEGSSCPFWQLSVTRIPTVPLRAVHRLQGSFQDFYQDAEGKYAKYRDCYLEISATDRELTQNPMALLKPRFPYLLSYRQELATGSTSSANMEERRRLIQQEGETGGPTPEIFTAFMEDIYQQLPPHFDQELALFKRILEERP